MQRIEVARIVLIWTLICLTTSERSLLCTKLFWGQDTGKSYWVHVWGQYVRGVLLHKFLFHLLIWIRYQCHLLWSLEDTGQATEPLLSTHLITLWSKWRCILCQKEGAESTTSRWDRETGLQNTQLWCAFTVSVPFTPENCRTRYHPEKCKEHRVLLSPCVQTTSTVSFFKQ